MSTAPPVSLVIVSRDRATGLKRLISALRYQSYRPFEVVVVSNYADAGFLDGLPGADNIRHVFLDEANISKARNIGITHSAGDIIAFCDDDAVPEPWWLERLVAPFQDKEVASTGGYVRGRNGIDFQWKAIKCDRCGDDYPMQMPTGNIPYTCRFDGTYFAKVQGTNCAFRKSALMQIGGFDETYRFYLDETDAALTLALAGWATTIVPLAEVQHGFEESAERTNHRVPKTLQNIGSSKSYFLDKFAGENRKASLDRLRKDQRARLLGLMTAGLLEPRDVRRLETSLEEGIRMIQPTSDKPDLAPKGVSFVSFMPKAPQRSDGFTAIAGTLLSRRKYYRTARRLVAQHKPVMVFSFSHTTLFHKRFFDVQGFWVQTGGLFGKSDRKDAIFRFMTLKKRADREIKSLLPQRNIVELLLCRIL